MKASGANIIILAVLAAILFSAGLIGAEDAQGPVGDATAGGPGMTNSPLENMRSLKLARRTYGYRSSDNRDPFEALILDIKDRQRDIDKNVTPPEMYDLDQMRVTGIILKGRNKEGHATVRLPDGKSYMFAVGTRVGIHGGRVVDIKLDRVIVKQTVRDHLRRLVEQTRELKLREEEEQ